MKAIEVMGHIDDHGNLSISQPIQSVASGQVRVIVLIPESADAELLDPDDTPIAAVEASLRRSLQQAASGQRLPLSQLWDGIDP
jgi:hypothetical protein